MLNIFNTCEDREVESAGGADVILGMLELGKAQRKYTQQRMVLIQIKRIDPSASCFRSGLVIFQSRARENAIIVLSSLRLPAYATTTHERKGWIAK